MDWLYFMAVTIALWMTARYLWKVEQVYSIAALLTGCLCLVWGFTCTPALGQLVITAVLAGLYRFYSVDNLMDV